MKVGIVGVPGGNSSEQLSNAMADLTGQKLMIDMNEVRLEFPSGSCWYGDIELNKLNGLVIKKIGSNYSPALLDRLEILRMLAARGLPVLSDPNAIIRMINRLSCTLALQSADIPMPPTTVTENLAEAKRAIMAYGSAVLKPLYSTKARGMLLLSSLDDNLDKSLQDYGSVNQIFYIQKMIQMKENLDLGVVFLGKDYLTTYARVKAKNAWNTTTVNGGHYEPFTPPKAIIKMAQKARDIFDLVFTCVDVAITEQYGPVVFEVSAFGGFKGIEQSSDLQPAALLAKYALQRIKQMNRSAI